MRSRKLSFAQKTDGALLLFIYTVPPILLSGIAVNAILFYMGSIPVIPGIIFAFFVVSYNAFGNFAPVFEVGAAELLDGARQRLLLLPYLFYLFLGRHHGRDRCARRLHQGAPRELGQDETLGNDPCCS